MSSTAICHICCEPYGNPNCSECRRQQPSMLANSGLDARVELRSEAAAQLLAEEAQRFASGVLGSPEQHAVTLLVWAAELVVMRLRPGVGEREALEHVASLAAKLAKVDWSLLATGGRTRGG